MLKIYSPRDAEQKLLIAAWVGSQIPCRPVFDDPSIISFWDGDDLVGAVVYSHYRGTDIEMSCACKHQRYLSRKVLRPIFRYPFWQLQCRRVTAIVHEDNAHSLDFNLRLGFVHEGVVRKAFGERDGVLLGMLREDCPWIRPTAKDLELVKQIAA